MHMGSGLLPAVTVRSFPAIEIESDAARSAGAQTPAVDGTSDSRLPFQVCAHPMSRQRRPGAAAVVSRLAARRLQNEFQVERYAAFLRLASSRESTSATIPSITV